MTDFVFVDHVRFGDLDARGHLNNVAFLSFVEGARQAFLRHVYPAHDPTVPSEDDVILAHTEIDYLSPARFEEEIHCTVRVEDVEPKKFSLAFELKGDDGRTLAKAANVMVGYDYEREESAEVASGLYEALQRAGA